MKKLRMISVHLKHKTQAESRVIRDSTQSIVKTTLLYWSISKGLWITKNIKEVDKWWILLTILIKFMKIPNQNNKEIWTKKILATFVSTTDFIMKDT